MTSWDKAAYVVAAEFSDAADARIACGMLCSEGIAAHVDSPIMSTLYGAGATWAPVRLTVPAGELVRAMELLRSHGDVD